MSLNKGSLDKAIRELKVKQLTIENQGAGANPTLYSNISEQVLSTQGLIIGDQLQIKGTGSYALKINPNFSTAHRTATFQDKDFTVADNADITLLKQLSILGVANRKYIPCGGVVATSSGQPVIMADIVGTMYKTAVGANCALGFIFPLPVTLGSKKLYIDAIRYDLMDADATNYITVTNIYGYDGTDDNTMLSDPTDFNSAQEVEITFTAEDCSTEKDIFIDLHVVGADIGKLKINNVSLRAYYDD